MRIRIDLYGATFVKDIILTKNHKRKLLLFRIG